MKIKVFVKHPGGAWREAEVHNTLKDLQSAVGGYIKTVTLCSDLVVICNEEGRLMGLEPCCRIANIDFVGTVLVAGVDGDEFADVPVSLDTFLRIFGQEVQNG